MAAVETLERAIADEPLLAYGRLLLSGTAMNCSVSYSSSPSLIALRTMASPNGFDPFFAEAAEAHPPWRHCHRENICYLWLPWVRVRIKMMVVIAGSFQRTALDEDAILGSFTEPTMIAAGVARPRAQGRI